MSENRRSNFDPSRDVKIWEHELALDEKKSLKIGKYNYDNKGEKFGVTRIYRSTNQQTGEPIVYTNPLGRFTADEFMQISSVINEKEGY